MTPRARRLFAACAAVAALLVWIRAQDGARAGQAGTPPPTSVFSDYRQERAGATHRITVGDLPRPFATRSVDNPPALASRPRGALPETLPGYSVTLYAEGLDNPRLVRTAPNGDLFVTESDPGRIKVLRGRDASGRAQRVETYATGLTRPFGIAFYPPGPNPTHVYIGNTDSVVRYRYAPGDLQPTEPKEVVVPDLPGGGRLRGGGHWTRDIAFSRDGRKMYVGIGSMTNIDDPDTNPEEKDRATILEFNPDGSGRRVYVSGIRNAVGLAVHPTSGQLWASVNERDGLGDNLVPDYVTHVEDGAFFGWPWFYMGGHQDPRHPGKHPELRSKVTTPDVLIQPHSASMQMVFYEGTQFPAEHRGSIFAAQHGSWNKTVRTGYKVIRVPLQDGVPTGEYEDFLTGFVTSDGRVWGRPVGLAVSSDGALIVTDDGSNTVWRVDHR